MILVDSLRYTYPALLRDQPPTIALNGVSLRLERGRCLAITGANGCGKTTLCLSVAGFAPRLTEGEISGTIQVAERDVQQEKPGALADVIGVVMQDSAGQVFNPTLADEIAWGLENLGVPPDEMEVRIESVLALVGLDALPHDRSPLTLSGGELKRLALASVLALRPQVLILDEPSGGLSPLARRAMVSVLRRLRDESQITILLAESDPEIIAALADELIILKDGQIAQQGAPAECYRMLNRAAFPGVAIPVQIRFERAIASTTNAAKAQKSTLKKQSHNLKPSLEEQSAIQLDNLNFSYVSTRAILHGITLTIPQGQFVALVGDNGAGKTTLARHLIGLLRPTSGNVHINGVDTSGQSIGQLAGQVGFAFQNPELQIFNPTVEKEIGFGPHNLGLRGAALETVVHEALTRFDLTALAQHPPAALSFSVRRMVALASIAAMNTPILVLDEPTVGLDDTGHSRVMSWLTDHHHAGATILLITHEMELAAHAERLIVLAAGEVIADGTPHIIFPQSAVLAKAGLEAPFAVQMAQELGHSTLPDDLTPEGAARAWGKAGT